VLNSQGRLDHCGAVIDPASTGAPQRRGDLGA
jgi:hypothetical protein